mmetsp:Transcript_4522/g.8687  ORF Transcript_4522/g.8687 Transcript_4522/m.8687 type:complete len:160 (+) Transcript_4522:1-480(+)
MRKKSLRIIRSRDSKFSCESLDTRHTSSKSTKISDKKYKFNANSQPTLHRSSLVRSLVLPQKIAKVETVPDLSYIQPRKESCVEQDSVFIDLATALDKPKPKAIARPSKFERRKSYLSSPYNSEKHLPKLRLLRRRGSSPNLTQVQLNGRRLASRYLIR